MHRLFKSRPPGLEVRFAVIDARMRLAGASWTAVKATTSLYTYKEWEEYVEEMEKEMDTLEKEQHGTHKT